MKPKTLPLYHIEHLSNDPAVLRFARRINGIFKRTGLTELDELDSEHEAVYLTDGDRIVSMVVFCRFDKNEYYVPVVWTSTKYRKCGCFNQLMGWLEEYAASKGAKRISTDVHHDNDRMVKIMDKRWTRSFLRFNYRIKAP